MSDLLYEAANITASWLGLNLAEGGWADDTFLTVVPSGPRKTVTKGADGKMAVSKMADKGAVITLTLKQSAPLNKKIAAIAAAEDMVGGEINFAPFTVMDKTGDSANFIALNATLTEIASNEFGNTMGEKTWVWECETYIETNDPATITAALSNYLSFL